MGTSCSKATIDVREIPNIAICKDRDVNILTINNKQQAHSDSTQTKHSTLDIKALVDF